MVIISQDEWAQTYEAIRGLKYSQMSELIDSLAQEMEATGAAALFGLASSSHVPADQHVPPPEQAAPPLDSGSPVRVRHGSNLSESSSTQKKSAKSKQRKQQDPPPPAPLAPSPEEVKVDSIAIKSDEFQPLEQSLLPLLSQTSLPHPLTHAPEDTLLPYPPLPSEQDLAYLLGQMHGMMPRYGPMLIQHPFVEHIQQNFPFPPLPSPDQSTSLSMPYILPPTHEPLHLLEPVQPSSPSLPVSIHAETTELLPSLKEDALPSMGLAAERAEASSNGVERSDLKGKHSKRPPRRVRGPPAIPEDSSIEALVEASPSGATLLPPPTEADAKANALATSTSTVLAVDGTAGGVVEEQETSVDARKKSYRRNRKGRGRLGDPLNQEHQPVAGPVPVPVPVPAPVYATHAPRPLPPLPAELVAPPPPHQEQLHSQTHVEVSHRPPPPSSKYNGSNNKPMQSRSDRDYGAPPDSRSRTGESPAIVESIAAPLPVPVPVPVPVQASIAPQPVPVPAAQTTQRVRGGHIPGSSSSAAPVPAPHPHPVPRAVEPSQSRVQSASRGEKSHNNIETAQTQHRSAAPVSVPPVPATDRLEPSPEVVAEPPIGRNKRPGNRNERSRRTAPDVEERATPSQVPVTPALPVPSPSPVGLPISQSSLHTAAPLSSSTSASSSSVPSSNPALPQAQHHHSQVPHAAAEDSSPHPINSQTPSRRKIMREKKKLLRDVEPPATAGGLAAPIAEPAAAATVPPPPPPALSPLTPATTTAAAAAPPPPPPQLPPPQSHSSSQPPQYQHRSNPSSRGNYAYGRRDTAPPHPPSQFRRSMGGGGRGPPPGTAHAAAETAVQSTTMSTGQRQLESLPPQPTSTSTPPPPPPKEGPPPSSAEQLQPQSHVTQPTEQRSAFQGSSNGHSYPSYRARGGRGRGRSRGEAYGRDDRPRHPRSGETANEWTQSGYSDSSATQRK